MWRKTLITTLTLALAAGTAGKAFAQDKKDEDAAKRAAAEENQRKADVAKAELEAARAKIQAELAQLRDKERLEIDAARDAANREDIKTKMERVAQQRRALVAEQQKLAELEMLKAREAADAVRADRVAVQDWIVNPRIQAQFAADAIANTKKVKIAYCGVGTSSVPAVLSDQLRLTPGMGLVIDYVEPKSPAEQSGLKQYDVMVKFDDQKLANSDQLRALIRLKKPGDDIKMTLVRQAQSKDMVVELGEKEIDEPVQVGAIGLPGDHIFVMAADGAPQVAVPAGGQAIAITNVNGKDQAVWSDGAHRLTIEMKGGNPMRLTVRPQDANADAKPLFEGPIETDEQRKAVPAEFAGKLATALAALPKVPPPGAVPPPPGAAGFAPAPVPMGIATARGNRVTVRAGAGGAAGDAGDVIVFENGVAAAPGGGGGLIAIAPPGRGGGNRVVTSTDKDNLMIARIDGGKVTHVLAFSQADGKTLFEGPVKTPEQRKAMPEVVAKQLEVLEKNQNIAPEFGVVGRN
jgi:hypothetical protein